MDQESIIKARLEHTGHELTIGELVRISHEMAKLKGWWENMDRNVPEQLALMHSEISEALEEFRAGNGMTEVHYGPGNPPKPEGFGIEIADLFVRAADTCGRYGIDLEACLRTKMLFNLTRPWRHNDRKC